MAESATSLGPNVLFVSDLERSKRFYCDLLNFDVMFEDENSAGLQIGGDMLMLLDPDAQKDLLVGGPAGSPKGRAPMGVFNLFVNDVDEWFNRLSEAGVAFLLEPQDRAWGRRTAHFSDPDGFVWEISKEIE
jgi:catechol 2,3-dioxygenase-like lactoylglutathione lyase family enzyme